MRTLLLAIFAIVLNLSCSHRKKLSEQLHDSFANHLKKIDSLAALDSVHILFSTAITQKMGRIIDDSIYTREFMRVQAQLLRSKQKNDKDSNEFYQNEINFMEKEIDSVNKSIAQGDTIHKYGYLIGFAYYITRNGKARMDSTMVLIDPASTVQYSEFFDSAIKRTIKKMN